MRLVTEDEVRVMCALYKKGLSIRAVAARTGRGYGTVHQWLSRSGVKLRTRTGTPEQQRARRNTRNRVGAPVASGQ